MAQQNFEQPLDGGNLRTQRMTADESRAVIDLWQQEQTELTGLTEKPAVPDVAEGLDITVEDVQRLLSEVRARRLEAERALVSEQTLTEAETWLADEEARLAEIQRQRAELGRIGAKPMRQMHGRRQEVLPRFLLRRSKPRQSAPIEWNGNEDFWQETEEDKVYRATYRAGKTKRIIYYGLLGVLLMVPLCLLLMLFLEVLVRLFT